MRPGYLEKQNDLNNIIMSIKNFIQSFTSEDSIEKLNECVDEDLNYFNQSDIDKNRIECSVYIKSLYESIDQFPQQNMSRDDEPFLSQDFYDDFYRFMKNNDMRSISEECETIIVLFPIKPNPNYVRTLTYFNGRSRLHVSFKILGDVMLFRPPNGCPIHILNIQSKSVRCEFMNVNFIHDIQSDSSFDLLELTSSLQCSFGDLNDSLLFEENGSGFLKEKEQAQVYFGNTDINGLIQNLNYYNEVFGPKIQSIDLDEKANIVNSFFKEMAKIISPSFCLMESMEFAYDDIPYSTKQFIDNIMNESNIDLSTYIDFSYYKPRSKILKELDNSFENCLKLTLNPNNNKYDSNISNDILKIKHNQFVAPIIFIKEDSLKVTAKTIDIKCDPLILGVDLQPFQMRLLNCTNDEIICEFQQNNVDLPLPTYKNDIDCLIIEIPVENLIKNTNKVDIDYTFEGKILLRTKSNPNLSTELDYSITLHYIALTVFIIMKNGHYFAVNKDKVEIVPFAIYSTSKILFEKFYNQRIYQSKSTDKINQSSNNDLIMPDIKINESNRQSFDIVSNFPNITTQNSNILFNYEFELTKEKSLITSFQTDMIIPMTLAIYSDETQNFEKENAIINIGNLTRKVYFIVEAFNCDTENLAKITNVKIKPKDRDNLLYHTFSPNKNNNSIQPNKFGHIICFFEVRYCGPAPFQNKNDNSIDYKLIVDFQGKTQTINFKYKIQTIMINESNIQYTGKVDNYYYYNFNNKTFIDCSNNLDEINSNSTFRKFDIQVLISPFYFSMFSKKNSNPKIIYDNNKGIISKISNNNYYYKIQLNMKFLVISLIKKNS